MDVGDVIGDYSYSAPADDPFRRRFSHYGVVDAPTPTARLLWLAESARSGFDTLDAPEAIEGAKADLDDMIAMLRRDIESARD